MAGSRDTPLLVPQPNCPLLYTKNGKMSTKIVLAQETQQLSHAGIIGIKPVSYTLVVVNRKSTSYLYRVGTLEIFVGFGEPKAKPANDQLRGVCVAIRRSLLREGGILVGGNSDSR